MFLFCGPGKGCKVPVPKILGTGPVPVPCPEERLRIQYNLQPDMETLQPLSRRLKKSSSGHFSQRLCVMTFTHGDFPKR